MKSLSPREIQAFEWRNEEFAAEAVIRAKHVLSTQLRNDLTCDDAVRLMLLCAKASLWLSRQAFLKGGKLPTHYSLQGDPVSKMMYDSKNRMEARNGLDQLLLWSIEDDCEFGPLRPFILANSAFTYILSVNRPGLAEARLVATQVQLALAECHAALGASSAGGLAAEPRGRMGATRHFPASEFEGHERMTYRPDVPVDMVMDGQTYLEPYWWGMQAGTCEYVFKHVREAMSAFAALEQLTVPQGLQERAYTTKMALNRRGSAAVISMARIDDPEYAYLSSPDMINLLRMRFPGTIFNPTPDFCIKLPIHSPEDTWCLSCMLPLDSWSIVTCMDLGPSYEDMIVANKMLTGQTAHLTGPDGGRSAGGDPYTPTGRYSPEARVRGEHKPTAEELFECLMVGMAGANQEVAVIQGPPRRPAMVLVAYRLRHAFASLAKLLEQIEVAACQVVLYEMLSRVHPLHGDSTPRDSLIESPLCVG